jgi:hypothetical protein
MSIEDSFWSKVDKQDSCWIWIAEIDKRGGYGRFGMDRRMRGAHVVAWELSGCPIPEEGWWSPKKNPNGRVLDHDYPEVGCGNPACVNPSHLVVVSHGDNSRRQRGLRPDNSSGVSGVYWEENRGSSPYRRGRWRVMIRRNGQRFGGYHEELSEAIKEAAAIRASRHRGL